jgi:hypothetical protein
VVPLFALLWSGAVASAPLVLGIDHVPVAVNDLEAAADRYRQLGFVLKPGRPHVNGIRNEHVKFPDGTEIELITAPKGVDPLTRRYRAHLDRGDGPAFLALFTRSQEEANAVDRTRVPYVFFGPRQASPTDRPEHFAHANSAYTLQEVWLAADDFSAERTLLARLGARFRSETVHVPDAVPATLAEFPQGTVVLLPARRQVVPGRRIVGMTVLVNDLSAASRVLGNKVERRSPPGRLFLGPQHTAGYWLEFRGR